LSSANSAAGRYDTNGIDMKSILKVSIRQIKAARALLGWSQEDLAAMAEISLPTVKRLEAADGLLGGRKDTGIKLRGALERAGIEFTNGKQPGVHLRKPSRKT
jgi:ribosome-binding protein aMBF1 (putative translation factor)